MRITRARILLVALAAACAGVGCAPDARAQAELDRPPVEPGPHAVGWKSFIRRDPSRGYADGGPGQGKRSRPIVFAVWYPAAPDARSERLRQEDYLALKDVAAEDQEFTQRLARQGRSVVIDEVVDAGGAVPAAAREKLLARYQQLPTLAHRNAPPRAGKFPLVIYHPGLGAVLEDTSPLLEHLASHGYVVVASAFPPVAPEFVQIDPDVNRSRSDLAAIIAQMRGDPQVDPDRIALMGHSFGGIASLASAMWDPSLIAAVVTFDSTLDYRKISDLPLDQADLAVFREPERLVAPALIIARPSARFELARGFVHSDRYLMHLDVIDHNAFLWHGVVGARLRKDASGPRRLAAYRKLITWTRRFLDAAVKGDPQATAAMAKAPAKGDPAFERLAAAKRGLATMDMVAGVAARGPEAGSKWLLEASGGDIAADVLNTVISALEERARDAEALEVAVMNSRLNPDRYDAHGRLGDVYFRRKDWPRALAAYSQGLKVLKAADYPAEYKQGNGQKIQDRIDRVQHEIGR